MNYTRNNFIFMCENDYNSFPQSIHIKNTWFFAELSSLCRNDLTRTNGYPVQKASVCYTQAPSYTKQKPILINYFCTRNYCNHFLWLFYLSLKRYIRTKGRTCLQCSSIIPRPLQFTHFVYLLHKGIFIIFFAQSR